MKPLLIAIAILGACPGAVFAQGGPGPQPGAHADGLGAGPPGGGPSGEGPPPGAGPPSERAPLPPPPTGPFPRNAWGKPDLNGVWGHDFRARGDKIFYALPVFGGLPDISMLQPWAQAAYKKNYDMMNAGVQVLNTSMRCLPAGVPNVMMEAHSLQVILTQGEIIFLAESDHQIRIIPIGDDLKHQVGVAPSWTGDSIAHWEGDALVIDTIGLTDQSELDPMSTPHSPQLHVVERITADDMHRLVINTTLNDPATLVRPWVYNYTFSKGIGEATTENVREYACAENNRDGPITQEKWGLAPLPESTVKHGGG